MQVPIPRSALERPPTAAIAKSVQKACFSPPTWYSYGHFPRNGLEQSPRTAIASGKSRPEPMSTAIAHVPFPQKRHWRRSRDLRLLIKRWTCSLDSGRLAGIPHFRPRGLSVWHRRTTVSEGSQRVKLRGTGKPERTPAE